MENKTFCSVLWNHQMVDGTGRVKPCCRFLEDHRPKNHTLDNHSIQDIFDSDFQNDLRERVLRGERLEGCRRCYEEEDNNKKSLRMRLNEHTKVGEKHVDTNDNKLEYLELSLSNDCNLMCRMCDSRYSFKLFDEEQEYHGKTFSKTKRTKANLDSIYPHLKDMKYIKFTGGEPLIIPDHWTLLEYAVEKGYAKNIELEYSINMTVVPQRTLDTIEQFKFVKLCCSVDGYGEVNEAIRHPTKWSVVEKNLDLLDLAPDNSSVFTSTTVSILNIEHFVSWMEWLKQREFDKINKDTFAGVVSHPVMNPKYLNLRLMTDEQNKRMFDHLRSCSTDDDMIEKLNQWEMYSKKLPMTEDEIVQGRKDLERFFSKMSLIQNKDWSKIFPMCYRMIQEWNE